MRCVAATRGSRLALWQARAVQRALEACAPEVEVELHAVRTRGDRDRSTRLEALGTTGVFTKEVDQEVLAGRAAFGVHSLKDQETTLPEGLVLGMVLPRGPVEDALIAADGRSGPAALPRGAAVATGSLRRRAQLLRRRPDLRMVGIRGNVETRVRKLRAGEADALVMARAGLERLGLAHEITEVLPLDLVLPAPSQGIVGVTCREDDEPVRELLAAAGDSGTAAAAHAERALLRALGGGCNVPVGALATPGGGSLHLRARVLSPGGEKEVSGELEGTQEQAEDLGRTLAEELLGRGAGALIAECRA